VKVVEKTISIKMIVVKYEPGALGSFLSCICHHKIRPSSLFDNASELVFHTGKYNNDHVDAKKFQEDFDAENWPVVSHNLATYEKWVKDQTDTKNIFIDIDSNFVEYRCNVIYKLPHINKKLNNYALQTAWKDFKYPVACDDARRVIRLQQKKEGYIKLDAKDIVFKFSNFYIDQKEQWIEALSECLGKIDCKQSHEELAQWFDCFQSGQKKVIDQAKIIYDCIANRRFVKGLSENEKGMIIGHHAVLENIDDPNYFITTYEEFTNE